MKHKHVISLSIRSLAVVLLAGAPHLAGARDLYGRYDPDADQNNRQEQNRPRRNPASTQPATESLSQAEDILNAAQFKLSAVVSRLKAKFNASDAMVAAKKAEGDQQVAYDQAESAVASKLASNPDYTAAVAKRDAIQKQLDDARDAGDQDKIASLAYALLDANGEVTKQEHAASTSDTATAQQLQQLQTAHQAVVQLQATFLQTMKDDPDWQAAKAAVDAAQKNLDTIRNGGSVPLSEVSADADTTNAPPAAAPAGDAPPANGANPPAGQ